MQLNLVGSSYKDTIIDINNQRCVNFFIAPAGPDGAGTPLNEDTNYTKVLKQTNGNLLVIDCEGSETRQQITVRNNIYQVVDSKIWKIEINPATLAATKTQIGSLNTSSGYVSIDYSQLEIMFVDGANGFLYDDINNVYSQIADVDFPNGCKTVKYIGGYFFVENPDTGEVFNSDLNDGSSWNSLNKFTAETSPDNVLAIAVTKEELWVLGEKSMEPWFNEGNAPPGSPFSLRKGLSISIGIKAIHSVINVNDSLFWLDSRGYIVQAGNSAYVRDNNTGYNLNIISTPAITEELKKYTTLTDCVATSYIDKGNIMIQWSFPANKKTWVWNTFTKEWHENLYYNTALAEFEHSLFQFASEVGDKTFVSGVRSGKLYCFSSDYQDNNGIQIRRQRSIPFIYMKEDIKKIITINQLALKVGVSQFPVTGDYQDLNIGMRYSIDGGRTWSSMLWRTVNQYDDIVTWNLLGTAMRWLFLFEMSDPISAALLDASIEAEVQQ